MARRSQETVEIKVCLERTGNDGSYLGMEKSGKLFLAPGGADITKDEYKFEMLYDEYGLVQFTSCAHSELKIAAHDINLTVDGRSAESGSKVWWNRGYIGDRSKEHLYITDGNEQKLYFYVTVDVADVAKSTFMVGNSKDKEVQMEDVFQITPLTRN